MWRANLEEYIERRAFPEIEGKDAERLGCGAFGKVYRISETEVAKVPFGTVNPVRTENWWRNESRFNKWLNEIIIQELAYEHNLPVPKPIGPRSIHLNGVFFGFSIIMEYIPGIDPSFCEWNKRIELTKHQDENIRKAEEKGFRTGDTKLGNTIYTPETDTLTMIDFMFWSHPKALLHSYT